VNATTHLGEICALLAPLAWSVAIVLYRKSDTPAVSMNLFKNVLAVVLLSITLVAIGSGVPADRPWSDWGRLVLSGLLGLSLADTLLFEGLRRVGAAGIAIVDTIYAPIVVALSWLILAEQPSRAFLLGAAIVVLGITVATVRWQALREGERGGDRRRAGGVPESRPEGGFPNDGTPLAGSEGAAAANRAGGLAYGFAAILCTAAAVVIAKPVLAHSELVEVTWTRLCVGVVGQVAWLVWTGQLREGVVAFTPGKLWWTLVPAAFVGTYVSMMLWLGGFKWADASVAAVLNQMATVYLLAQARFVLGETLRPAQIVGALLAATGALVVVLSRWVG
jgi:drug/metabolite transporter (DMT)-like permease